MRKAINGLSLIVADHLEQNVFSGHLFAFCNRSRTIIKILYWDHNWFCLWQKRLEKERFHWPESVTEMLELDPRRLALPCLAWLLDGLDPLRTHGHEKLHFSALF